MFFSSYFAIILFLLILMQIEAILFCHVSYLYYRRVYLEPVVWYNLIRQINTFFTRVTETQSWSRYESMTDWDIGLLPGIITFNTRIFRAYHSSFIFNSALININ